MHLEEAAATFLRALCIKLFFFLALTFCRVVNAIPVRKVGCVIIRRLIIIAENKRGENRQGWCFSTHRKWGH